MEPEIGKVNSVRKGGPAVFTSPTQIPKGVSGVLHQNPVPLKQSKTQSVGGVTEVDQALARHWKGLVFITVVGPLATVIFDGQSLTEDAIVRDK